MHPFLCYELSFPYSTEYSFLSLLKFIPTYVFPLLVFSKQGLKMEQKFRTLLVPILSILSPLPHIILVFFTKEVRKMAKYVFISLNFFLFFLNNIFFLSLFYPLPFSRVSFSEYTTAYLSPVPNLYINLNYRNLFS